MIFIQTCPIVKYTDNLQVNINDLFVILFLAVDHNIL